MTCNLLSQHPVQNQQSKICQACSNIFNRTYQNEKIWSKQIYCSKKCSNSYKKIDISSSQITCRVCNISKPLSDFDKRNNSYYSICRSCRRKEGKERNKLSSFKKSRSTIRYEQLLKFEKVRFNTDGFIEVKCKRSECKRWFTPSMRQIDDRVRAFNGTSTGDSEHNFYCSDECKGSCELYGKQSMPEIKAIESGMSYDEYLRTKTARDTLVWNFVREKIIKLDNNMCCVCGSDQNIEVHHQIPAAMNPMIMYDPDNLITLCEKCHVNIHSGKCSYHNISRKSCHKKYYYKNGKGMPKEWAEDLRQSKYNGENKKDLSGQRFGRLIAIEFVNRNEKDTLKFMCICDCGNEITTTGNCLSSGDTKSCGCISKEMISNKRNLKIGNRYGLLTIESYHSQCKKGAMYVCKCDCGGEKIVVFEHLRRGSVKSCGCRRYSGLKIG